MTSTVIVDGFRTAFCREGTVLKDVPPDLLGTLTVKEMVKRLKNWDLPTSVVDFVIGSNVATPPNAPNIARVVAMKGGLPEEIPADTINKNCGSGLAAIEYGNLLIKSGTRNTVLVVGVESMSRIPFLYPEGVKRDFLSLAYAKTKTEKIKSLLRLLPKQLQVWKKEYQPQSGLLLGLTDPICNLIMGLTAENLAKDPSLTITRQEQDAFAVRSHQKAAAAKNNKLFKQETADLYVPGPNSYFNLTDDNGIRADINVEKLARLKPFFDRKYGTVTAGNSSQVTDGAACVLLMNKEKAQSLGLPALGYITDYADVGFKPEIMGLAPVGAITKVIQHSSMKLKDFEVVEINEAFAAQVLACLKVMNSNQLMKKWFFGYGLGQALGEIDDSQLNPRGGAIALGHPVGVTGIRLVLTALNELKTRNQEYALVSACIGGGQGNAMIVRRDNNG